MDRNKQLRRYRQKKSRQWFVVGLFLTFFTSLIGLQLVPALQPEAKALQFNYQNVVVSWVDKGTIIVRGQETAPFIDSNPNDATREFIFTDSCGDNKIRIVSGDNVASITYSTALQDPSKLIDTSSTGCGPFQTNSTIEVKNTENANKTPTNSGGTPVINTGNITNPYSGLTFAWRDAGAIKTNTGNNLFTSTDGKVFTNTVISDGNQTCFDKIDGISSDFKKANVKIFRAELVSGGENCVQKATFPITLTAVANQKKPAQTESPDVTIPCEGGIPVLGWFICAVAKGADSFSNTVESAINSLLSIPPESYGEGQSATDNDGVNGLKTAWSAVRIIASLLLVGVALVMVLSQIFSFDFVSAYTVKKVLPKLVIATILIQLSWVLFTGFIQVIDTISFALRDLLLAPFGGSQEVNIANIFSEYYTNNGVAGAQISTVGFSLLASTAGLAAIGGGFGLLFAALGVLMAIVTAFVTLVIRKVIIIVLLVLSPLALVAWILPNTQKLWSTWWQLFSKLTLMFPLVVLLLTSGKIFAYLTAQQNTGGWISFYIIIVAYFGPFFLIPATFKFAGNLFGKLGAAVSGAGNKFKASDPFDWKKKSELTNSKLAKKSRQADFARQRQSDYANLISGGSNIPGRSRFARYRSAGSATGRARASANAAAQSVSEAGKDLESIVGGDPTALNALAKYNSVDEMRAAGVSDSVISRVGKFAGDREYQAAALLQSAGMGKAETEMFKNVAKQYGDDQTFASKIIGDAAYKAKSGGDITNGTLGYNFAADPKSGGAVDWLDYGTNPPSPISAQEAVSKKLKEMQTSEISSLKVKANSSGGIEFADKLVAAHFAANPDHAAQILSTPNIQLDANVEKLLRASAASSSLPTSPPPIDVHPV